MTREKDLRREKLAEEILRCIVGSDGDAVQVSKLLDGERVNIGEPISSDLILGVISALLDPPVHPPGG